MKSTGRVAAASRQPTTAPETSPRGIPPVGVHFLVEALVIVAGCGAFLRLVGKEKRRREKYLQLRLEEVLKDLKDKQGAEGNSDPAERASETP